jgi:hypothetical protein
MTLPTIEQLEAMTKPHDGTFSYEANSHYDLRKGPVVGHIVRFRPTPKDLGGGLKSFGMAFPVCAASDLVAEPEKAMAMVADALNAMPTLATQRIADAKRIAELEAALRSSRLTHCDIAEHCLQAKADGHPIDRAGIFADSQRARIAAEKILDATT